MSKAIAFAIIALVSGCATQAALKQPGQSPAIFAAHDCCGRLEHSNITKVGEIRSAGRAFTIYSFWFVNPRSHHGMKRLAVTEGNEFRGSYIISSWATPVLRGGVVKFICANDKKCEGEDFAISDGKIPHRLWIDGEVHDLEDTI